MKGKLLDIDMDLPEQVRYNPEDYEALCVEIRKQGGNPYTLKELETLYNVLEDIRILTSRGYLIFKFEDGILRFDFYPGFVHNTSSVPDVLKWIKDNDDFDMYVAGMPHDGVYTGRQMSKDAVDRLFVSIVEYYHDNEGDEGFFENIIENGIEAGIALAFDTDEAQRSWDRGAELAQRSGCFMTLLLQARETF